MQYLYYRMIKKTNTDTQTTPDVPNHTIMFYLPPSLLCVVVMLREHKRLRNNKMSKSLFPVL